MLESGGHKIIWKLAQLDCHPTLTLGNLDLAAPTQSSAVSLTNCLQQWKCCLLISWICGAFPSDCCFVETFIGNMNGAFNGNLKLLMLSMLHNLPTDVHAPHHWQLSSVVSHFCGMACFNGITMLTAAMVLRDFAASQSRHPNPTQGTLLVHQVTNTEPPDTRQTDLVADTKLLACVCAIAAAGPCVHGVCGSANHMVAKCPKLCSLLSDLATCKHLFFVIWDALPSGGGHQIPTLPSSAAPGAHSTTPLATNCTCNVHSVLQDKDTGTDVSTNQLTGNKGTGADFQLAHRQPLVPMANDHILFHHQNFLQTLHQFTLPWILNCSNMIPPSKQSLICTICLWILKVASPNVPVFVHWS